MPGVGVPVTLGVVRSEGASASRPTSEGARSSRLASDVADGNTAELEPADAAAPARSIWPRATELVRLRDGSSVRVRAASARDERALLWFLSGLCLEARRLRFFTGAADIAYAAHMASATDARRYGLI